MTREYLVDPDFTPENVAEKSHAAGLLVLWARTMIAYADTLHKIEEKLANMMDMPLDS